LHGQLRKIKMANITQAIKWMRQGKKITRPSWDSNSYWTIVSITQRIIWADGTNASVHLNQLEANDWKIWEKVDLSKISVDDLMQELIKR